MSNQTTYAYDLGGNIVQKTLPNGLKEVRAHDGRNRVSTLRNQNSAGTDIAGYAYQYDAAGNVMEVVEDYPAGNMAGRTITNAYDGVYRLLTEAIATSGGSTVTTEYEYDKGHNRTSKAVSGGATTTYVIGDGTNGAGANQIVSATMGGVTTEYAYDANGNRSSRTVDAPLTGDTTNGSVMITGLASTTGLAGGMAVSGTGIPSGATVANIASSTSVTLSVAATATATGTTITFGNSDTYHYDDENRLIQLVDENGANPGTYTYGYDYRTRRVARTEPGPVTTNIVFDGGVSIIEYGPAGAASPNVEYVRGHDYGGGVGGLEYSVRNGTASFNFYDSRGDVTTQTDASATVTFQTGYEAFGNQTTTSGSTLDRQKASTKEQDPTGLLNEGFRYRDPETGTFLTRDPLGFKAGPNMYTYVRQNPWTRFDPEGLSDDPHHWHHNVTQDKSNALHQLARDAKYEIHSARNGTYMHKSDHISKESGIHYEGADGNRTPWQKSTNAAAEEWKAKNPGIKPTSKDIENIVKNVQKESDFKQQFERSAQARVGYAKWNKMSPFAKETEAKAAFAAEKLSLATGLRLLLGVAAKAVEVVQITEMTRYAIKGDGYNFVNTMYLGIPPLVAQTAGQAFRSQGRSATPTQHSHLSFSVNDMVNPTHP